MLSPFCRWKLRKVTSHLITITQVMCCWLLGWLSNSGLPFPLSQSRLYSSQQRIFYLAQISGLHVSILFHHLNCSYLNKKRQRDDRPGTKLKRHRKTVGKGRIRAVVPKLLGIRHRFRGRWFFPHTEEGDGFQMIHGHYVSCALYYSYISSTSDIRY